MKFRLLIMPTIQTTVNAIPIGRTNRMIPGPNGSPMNATVMPVATAMPGEHELAEELPSGAQVVAIVERTDDDREDRRRRTGPSEIHGRDRPWAGHPGRCPPPNRTSPPPTTRNAMATAMPPPRGTGAPCVRRSSGWSRIRSLPTTRRIQRRRDQRNERRRDERADDDGHRRAGGKRERHPASSANRPGTGKRAAISAASARRRAPAAASPRCAMASVMIRAIVAHLVRPEAAGRRGRACRAGSRTRCSAAADRTGSRSC